MKVSRKFRICLEIFLSKARWITGSGLIGLELATSSLTRPLCNGTTSAVYHFSGNTTSPRDLLYSLVSGRGRVRAGGLRMAGCIQFGPVFPFV